ncbi:conserved Plasmodium protein, unknown function [Plasmodium vinckei brucechwatti]|uniref:Uncharacterized protein n=1 Tax=Plasmodium vinckei brucechwatti TaxID=119398 RepID=A0A6V7RZP7_PLAVN|nr:conserved Plasmodium protein, unknown function [Plasmodium vinckei brucechwatti]
MKKSIKISYILFLSCLLIRNGICQSFLPVSYATHKLYSFDKVSPNDIKSNVNNIVSNFITSNLKVIKNKIDDYNSYYKNNDEYDSLVQNEYDASLEDEVKSLLQQSKNKRKLAKKIKESYNRALNNLKNRKGKTNDNYQEDDDEITKNMLEHNLEQIHSLNKKSEYLENKAMELKKYINKSQSSNSEDYKKCNISKTGKLKFVSSSNGLKHSIDNVQGIVNHNGFSIFYKKKKKMTYLLNIIELPIKIIGNVEQCFSFVYKNVDQIFCTNNKLKTLSWVNSLTEASFCANFKIKGILINLDNIDNESFKNIKKDNLLRVHIKPDEKGTQVFVNGKKENAKENGGVINLNKIKKQAEDEEKISKKEMLKDDDTSEQNEEYENNDDDNL